MVEIQIAGRGIHDPSVLQAMREVPRERFVDPGSEDFAYEDSPVPIGAGQTISQPYIVAFMIEAAELRPTDRVLEVGAGSGYAAAVMSRLAARVYGIERHELLVEGATRRLQQLRYDNVELRVGDGTRGWPEAAPFDAILVSAGGPEVPEILKEQLVVGGRLVIPVGLQQYRQTLRKLRRVSPTQFESEDLGNVAFVPLIGEQGWAEDAPRLPFWPPPHRSVPEQIAGCAQPLAAIGDPGFAQAFDAYANCRVVLLGEATHGTSEFYRARAAITQHLIAHHGFSLLAVEADWPDAAVVDRYIRHRPSQPGESRDGPFRRFPTWMWRNLEFERFIEWLRAHNAQCAPDSRTAFYGLDLYNLSASMAAVLEFLEQVDPEAAALARQRYGCLMPWQNEPSSYGRAVLRTGARSCEQAVVDQCRRLLEKGLAYAREDRDSFLDAAQNARLVASAERYYRIMYRGGPDSWNLRDTHMFETLVNVLEARGPTAKAVVWAHNSHIGDARHTDMGKLRAQLSIGQLCRERFGESAALIGFGTHRGTVAAADKWDGKMKIKQIRPSLEDSYERLCHDSGVKSFLLRSNSAESLRQNLLEPRLERFIGVLYVPATELSSHYAQCSLPRQFDAFVWFDETTAITPLGPQHAKSGAPDTYPFGL